MSLLKALQQRLCCVAVPWLPTEPSLGSRLVNEIVVAEETDEDGRGDDFRFYLLRHVELDGNEHGPMAARLIEELCGQDNAKWQAAEEAAAEALDSRVTLWSAIYQAVVEAASRSR